MDWNHVWPLLFKILFDDLLLEFDENFLLCENLAIAQLVYKSRNLLSLKSWLENETKIATEWNRESNLGANSLNFPIGLHAVLVTF